MKALMIGGTGPTGVPIVQGLIERGYAVEMLHTGRNEVAETPDEVVHLHADVYDPHRLEQILEGRNWDLCVAAYGRLRKIAELLSGKVGRFVSIGGLPALLGYMNPYAHEPLRHAGPNTCRWPARSQRVPRHERLPHRPDRRGRLPSPTRGDALPLSVRLRPAPAPAPRMADREAHSRWSSAHHPARRRPHPAPTSDTQRISRTRSSPAIDKPENTLGEIYNAADSEVLTLRAVVELISEGLGHRWEIVNIAVGAGGSRASARDATPKRRTAYSTRPGCNAILAIVISCRPAKRWYGPQDGWSKNPLSQNQQRLLEDPFDYAAEDALIEGWKKAVAGMPEVEWKDPPRLWRRVQRTRRACADQGQLRGVAPSPARMPVNEHQPAFRGRRSVVT